MSIKKFRRKLKIIEAKQWLGLAQEAESINGIIPYREPNTDDWASDYYDICKDCDQPIIKHGYIKDSPLFDLICPGDWIMTSQKGEIALESERDFNAGWEEIKTSQN